MATPEIERTAGAESGDVSPAPEKRYPWLKFYPTDWQADERLGLCSLAARGLLAELMCVMHRAEPYGHLLVNGKQPSDPMLARLVRASSRGELRRLRAELIDNGVLSVLDDGTIYSRRMVRDAARSRVGQQTGRMGGNPALKALTPPLSGGDNTQMPEARSQNPEAREESAYGASPPPRPSKTRGRASISNAKIAFAGTRLKAIERF
jgi:hypothetical protein